MTDHQILEHSSTSVDYTLFDVKWIPSSPRLVTCGSSLAGEGHLRVYSLSGQGLNEVGQVARGKALRIGTFISSSEEERLFCTGDFAGNIAVWDLERLSDPVQEALGHNDIINSITGGVKGIDRVGDFVTGSRDGLVKVWDRRNLGNSVMTMEGDVKRDCWAVASFDNGAYIAAGYSNGDIRLFDVKAGKVFWETSLPVGVTSLHFISAKEGKMDRLIASTLRGGVSLWDLQTRHRKFGYTKDSLQLEKTTVWSVEGVPQKHCLFAATLGSGLLEIVEYKEPGHRVMIGADGVNVGTPGEFIKKTNKQLTDKPITSLNWSPDKAGLLVTSGFDQKIRVIIVTGVDPDK